MKFLGRFILPTGQGDMIGFVLLKRKNMVKAANHYNRNRAVWYCTWDRTVKFGAGWSGPLTASEATDLARLLKAAGKEAHRRAVPTEVPA